jgi:hypothetical protein
MRRLHRCWITASLHALLAVSPGLPTTAPVAAGVFGLTTCANSGAGSLPFAVLNANANDTILFSMHCTEASPIRLTSTLTLTKNVTIDATVGGHTVVDGGCTLSGNVCASGGVRVFAVNAKVTATLKGLTIQHGSGNGGGDMSPPSARSRPTEGHRRRPHDNAASVRLLAVPPSQLVDSPAPMVT